ncbi:MAG: hypothetical protein Kow0025_14450 [Thermodesulfovibrionales bacterium]
MAVDKKVLVAVDESENSKMALLYAADILGGVPGFRAIVVSVLSVPEDGFFESDDEKRGWTEKKRRDLAALLERYRQILIQSGFPEGKVLTELVVTEDRPVADVILEKQEQYDCCTLIVGRRGISRHEEFLFGSVSSRLIHKANRCAVWVVEPVCKTSY